MPDDVPTLSERLAKVPRLLANYMPTWFRNRQPQAGGQNQEEASTSQQQPAAALMQAQEVAVTPAVSSLLLLAMQEHAPTLPDIMARVPHLLSCCMSPSEEDDLDVGCDIRVLRCVNKELSHTAMQMVTHCSLELGDGVSPDHAQMVRLLSDSGLKTLRLTISTTSGRNSPLLAAQLATVTSQTKQLLTGLRRALRTVTSLTVTVTHELHKSSRSSSCSHTAQSPPSECPASFSIISRTVCTLLAPAMPSLKSLTVVGCCRDPALGAFGASCPQLTDLLVEAISFPIKALKNAETLLPNLRCFTLHASEVYTEVQQLTEYVGGCLSALEFCTSLTRMVLELDADELLDCKPGSWEQAPSSLREFVCHCEILGISSAQALLKPLHSLEIVNTPERGLLLRILANAPDLIDLSLAGYEDVMLCCNHTETLTAVASMHSRVLDGLELDIPGIGLEGIGPCVQTVLSALPPLPSVERCHLRFFGVPDQNCLVEVARVFPHVESLFLVSHAPWQDAPWRGEEFLRPLAACEALSDLRVRVQLAYSTAELVRLCLSIPCLSYFEYMKCKGASLKRLDSAMAAKGHSLLVREL